MLNKEWIIICQRTEQSVTVILALMAGTTLASKYLLVWTQLTDLRDQAL